MKESPLQKVTLNLFAGDFSRLQELFPDIGASVVVRKLVRNYITALDAKELAAPKTEVNL